MGEVSGGSIKQGLVVVTHITAGDDARLIVGQVARVRFRIVRDLRVVQSLE
jgi:hypothetical protein